jgi:MFS family permease
MTYGIYQEYYESSPRFSSAKSTLGVIGTTQNGVMYLLMPLLSGLLCRRFASYRRMVSLIGVCVACIGFLSAGFCASAAGLVVTQGVLSALGCALLYTPTMLVLSEVFGHEGRAVAYGVVLSAKNVTGSGVPFLMRWLLSRYGLRTAMVTWTVVVAVSGVGCVWVMPMSAERGQEYRVRERAIPWGFLRGPLFWVYAVAIVLQSSGYGIPQTYLSAYAHSVLGLEDIQGTLLITLFNAPGILASTFFGWVSDNRWRQMSAPSSTLFSAMASGLAALLLWGFCGGDEGSLGLLCTFAVVAGFFAGGYSATWGGIIKEMEVRAAEKNEAIDTGMVYGLLNGARGIGYVGGGLAGVQLLKAGNGSNIGRFGYGTAYGPLIVYTGLSMLMGGAGIVLRCKKRS